MILGSSLWLALRAVMRRSRGVGEIHRYIAPLILAYLTRVMPSFINGARHARHVEGDIGPAAIPKVSRALPR